MQDDERYVALIPCRDAGGRPREFGITATRLGEVSIIVPPGCSARVTVDQVQAVCDALLEARKIVTRGRTQ